MNINIDNLRIAVTVLRGQVLRFCSRDSCIITVKCLQELMALVNVEVKPLQVECKFSNAEYERDLNTDNPLQDPKAWSVGLGIRMDDKEWALHVVGWIPSMRLLVDPSLDQASRPERGLETGPVILPIPERDLDYFCMGGMVRWQRNGQTLRYRVVARDDYSKSPNWMAQDAGLRNAILHGTARQLEFLQLCHGAGWPDSPFLCRGARDFQLMIFHRMGFLDAPTDEAWQRKCDELGIGKRKTSYGNKRSRR